MVHARTLDWSWLEGLEGLLIDLRVVSSTLDGGDSTAPPRLLYRATGFVGFVGALARTTAVTTTAATTMHALYHHLSLTTHSPPGVLTGMREGSGAGGSGGWSVSLNYRRPFRGEWRPRQPDGDENEGGEGGSGDESKGGSSSRGGAEVEAGLAVPPVWRNVDVVGAVRFTNFITTI